ncbi:MAG: protein kinase domain-containing protein [Gaiellaceae bacterium]
MTTTEAFAGGRYSVERRLGHGGMATVYLAHDRELDRPVAIKVLGAPLALDAEFVGRFRREATTVARLSHPNIVQIFDLGEEENRLYIVMEYVEGESLAALLARKQRLAPERAVELGLQACLALQLAHSEGVVHRDVKPANLLLRGDGTLKVADFGIARSDQATAYTQAGTVLGTASYLAPEQAVGEPVTGRADLYSLGVVLYELLAGEPPRRIESLAQLAAVHSAPVRPVRELAPEVPEHLEAAVMRCLARNPDYRPASAAELGASLRGEPTAPTLPAEPATVPLPRVFRRPPLGRRELALAIAAGIVAGVIAVFAFTAGGEDRPREPVGVQPVPAAGDPAGRARNLEDWIRDHTAAP